MKKMCFLLIALVMFSGCANQSNETVTITASEYEALKNNGGVSPDEEPITTSTSDQTATDVASASLDGIYASEDGAKDHMIIEGEKLLFYSDDSYASYYGQYNADRECYLFEHEAKDGQEAYATIEKIGDNVVMTYVVTSSYDPQSYKKGYNETLVFKKDSDLTNSDSFNDGQYLKTYSNETMYLTKDGDKILLSTTDGDSDTGDIDPDAKSIKWQNDPTETSYECVGNALVLFMKLKDKTTTISMTYASEEDVSEAKAVDAENAKYTYLGEHDHLHTGQYTVGTDIKPGTYTIRYHYMDYDEELSVENDSMTATVAVISSSEEQKITLKDFDETTLTLDADWTVKVDMMGDDSYMTLSAEE